MSGCGNGIFRKHELYSQKLPWGSPIYHTNVGDCRTPAKRRLGIQQAHLGAVIPTQGRQEMSERPKRCSSYGCISASLKNISGLSPSSKDMPWHNKSWRSLTFRFFYATKATEYSTGSSQVRYVENVDRVLPHSEPDWIHSYYEWQTKRAIPLDWNTDFLSLAIYHNLARYVQQQIRTNGKGIM